VSEVPNTKYYFQNTENTKYWDPKYSFWQPCILSGIPVLCVMLLSLFSAIVFALRRINLLSSLSSYSYFI